MSSTQPQDRNYLILGAGCFGASTAWYIKRTWPSANVILVDRTDFPCQSAAGYDLNKIIRAEYEDPVYMKLALEAQSLWRTDSILKPYYHETGILFAAIAAPGITIINNYKALTGSSPAELINPQDARERFGDIFRDAEWPKVESCIWNPSAGWGEAENALRSVIQAAVDL
jgi:sarcosine oxidase / L-pipecolate oxidase